MLETKYKIGGCLCIIVMMAHIPVWSQDASVQSTFDATRLFSTQETYGTPVHEENDGKKHYLVAITGALLPEFLFSVWCRFVTRNGWAQVSWDEISRPWERSLQWDTDWVWTNFALHPFQGSLYYMAARNANLNRIESMAVTGISDAIWEWFFETTDPSINDLAFSFFGGFALGEIMYRLSLEAEQTHAIFGYLLNPERIWSEPWIRQRPRGTIGNIYELSVRTSLGTTHALTTSDFGSMVGEHFPLFIVPEVNVVYNDPYGHDSNNPFSQFEFRMGGGVGVGSGVWRGIVKAEKYMLYDIFIWSNGMLLARAPEWGENRDTTIGFVFDYDFRWHSFIDLAALAPGVAIKQRIRYDASRIEWQAHLDWDMIGVTDYYYAHRDPAMNKLGLDHDYSYFTGCEGVFVFKYITDAGIMIENNLHAYMGYDFSAQAQDGQSTGWEFFCFYDVDVELPLSKIVRMGIGNQLYVKKSLYADVGNVFQMMASPRVYAKLQFK